MQLNKISDVLKYNARIDPTTPTHSISWLQPRP